jgi:hypothetical protein
MSDQEQWRNQNGDGEATGSGGEGEQAWTPWAAAEGGGDAAFALDQESGEAPKRRINEGLILLAGVLLVAGAALYFMRSSTDKTGNDAAVSAVELKIEKALAQLGGQSPTPAADDGASELLLEKTDQVVERFVVDPTEKQVALENVRKNPFALRRAAKGEDEPAPQKRQLSYAEQQQERRLRQLRDEFSRLELQTVMAGRTPMAVISGEVVRERGTLGSFTVVAIEDRSVSLAAEGNTYRLTMERADELSQAAVQ